MKATGIKMNIGCESSGFCGDIHSIRVKDDNGENWHEKADVHKHLLKHPGSIHVDIAPYYPKLEPATSINGVKYVRSEPNDTPHDNLLKLPKYRLG